MKRFLAVLGLTIALAAPGFGLEPIREGQETFISRAVFAQDKLWVLSDAGQLFTITEGEAGRKKIALPEDAVDLWLKDGKPAVVTCWGKHCDTWNLRQQQGDDWPVFARIPSDRLEMLHAITEAEGATVLVTDHRVLEWKGGAISSLQIQVTVPRGIALVSSVLVRPGRILVGINAGEWGGGLRAIDRKTGRLTVIESNTMHTLCGGPLNTACDPVNGLVAEPGKPGCVLAAVGLVHFGPHGRIVEVCGEAVKRLYFRNLPCKEEKPGEVELGCTGELHDGEMDMHTEAFFGLTPTKDAVWAVGIDGLYKITPTGAVRFGALPEFKNYGGTWASFAIPGIVLVLTEINARKSLSGATPLIVPRE